MLDDKTLVLKSVVGESEVETLRTIRNECSKFMTRSTEEITREQQIKWYENISDDVKLYLLHLVEFGVIGNPIGYGLIRKEEGVSVISGGLIKQYRGLGYGKILFEYLIKNVDKGSPLSLEVLKSNTVAANIYRSLGFKEISDNGKVITMIHEYDSVI